MNLNHRSYLVSYLFWVFLLIFSTSCNSLKNLGEDEYILTSNSIQFITDVKINDLSGIKLDLASFYKQKPYNPKFWNPRDWIGAKELTIYDPQLTNLVAEDMQKYLRNKKGFYQATVSPKELKNGKKVKVVYAIESGIRYKLSSIEIISQDSLILKSIAQLDSESYIKDGMDLDASLFDLEKTRITTGLQNNGYADFTSNYIQIKGDSSDYMVDVQLEILTPAANVFHKKYRIGDINVYTEHYIDEDTTLTFGEVYDQKYYHSKTEKFIVKPYRINNHIFLNKGEYYKKDLRQKSFRSLSTLSAYRFLYIDPTINQEMDSIIDFDIYLTPQNNKYSFDFGGDLFYSQLSRLGSKLFGISGSAGFRNRNLLGGSELYSLDLEGTLELDITAFKPNTYGFGIRNNLLLPRQVDLFGLAKMLKSIGLIKESSYNRFKDESTTELKLSYNFSNIINLYKLNSLNASWGYNYHPSPNVRYIFEQVGLNFSSPETGTDFTDEVLALHPLLARSFDKNLFTGFLFRNLAMIYQSPKTRFGSSRSFIGNFEVSGLENYIINKGVNLVSNYNEAWTVDSINFSKFIRFELDNRFYRQFSPSRSIAARIDFGLAIPYGGDNVIPFQKQFIVGGPNSIRAWQIRELGPGGFSELLENPVPNQSFYQSGDLKLEFNLEFRFDMFYFVEGAIFLDGGNVWSLRNDPSRPDSNISSAFLNQIALGTGFGIRFDLDYFLIRFDFGYKLRNPYANSETGKRWALGENSTLGNINIAVNYPF